MYEGAEKDSIQDGIHFIRQGSIYTTQSKSRTYLASLRRTNLPDVVIDEVNTLPFFPARVLPKGTVVVNLIHQLAREFWFYETPLPVALLGRYWLEERWLKEISSNPTITVSESSRSDLQTLGFKNVRIIHSGVSNIPSSTTTHRAGFPVILFLGRLTKAKKPQDACQAYNWLRSRVPCSMTVIGSGPLFKRLKLQFPGVQFVGRVTEDIKRDLLRGATFIFVPGVREGWGRVILEAQALGVVPIVYDVPGLRDAVDFGRVGVLASENTPEGIGRSAYDLMRCPGDLAKLVNRGYEWAKQHTYDASAAAFESCLLDPGFVSI
jgi:glycosyltransferase involved in cell wall biosynthesis